MANDARMGKVTYTIQDPVDGSTQFCNVEQLAIHHYRTEADYTHGSSALCERAMNTSVFQAFIPKDRSFER